jgi:hypothetical protein
MYNKIYVLWKVKRTCNLELTKCFLFAGKTIYYALNLKKKERLALLTFCVLPISLSKISPHRSYPSRAATSCARYCRPPRRAPHLALRGSAPKSSARIHLTPRPSSPRHAPSPAAPAPAPAHCMPCPRCYALWLVPRARWGAAIPHQKVVPAIDAMAAAMRDLSNEMLRWIACCKRFRGMLQLFYMDIAKVDQECCTCCICCKCFRGLFKMFHLF